MLTRIWALLVAASAIFLLTTSTAQPPTEAEAQPLPTSTLPPTTTVGGPTVTLPALTPTLPISTPTLVPTTGTATVGATATAVGSVTPGAGAELRVVIEAADVVPPGAPIDYFMQVINAGSAPSSATTVVAEVPAGASVQLIIPPCTFTGNGVSCPVPSLPAGGTIAFQFGVMAAGPGTIVATATVDPSNLIPESIETNNSAVTITQVVPPGAGVPPPLSPVAPPPAEEVPSAPPPATEIPSAPPAAAPAPVTPPIDVAGVQVVPPTAQTGELWLQVLAPTMAYSVEMEPLWVAAPGEWYIVTQTQDGWALSVYEFDTTGWSVWIPMDERVVASVVDRTDPTIATDVWLVPNTATEAYAASSMQLAWTAQPGEWYQVLQHDSNWALAVSDTDPSRTPVWIAVDPRVELAPGDAPHSPA